MANSKMALSVRVLATDPHSRMFTQSRIVTVFKDSVTVPVFQGTDCDKNIFDVSVTSCV